MDAVALADKYLDSLNKRPKANFQHQDLPDEELKDLLLKLRGTLGKKQLLRTDSRLAEIAARPDLKQVLALGSSSADHMLRIRPKSATVTLEDTETGINEFRESYAAYFEANKSLIISPSIFISIIPSFVNLSELETKLIKHCLVLL